MHKYHIFLIHLSVVLHLGCFHNLDVVKRAEINMVCRCLWSNLCYIPLGISLGVVLLDYMADLCLVFQEASILFSKVVVLAYIPTSSV
jgi:hypothetical protein